MPSCAPSEEINYSAVKSKRAAELKKRGIRFDFVTPKQKRDALMLASIDHMFRSRGPSNEACCHRTM